MPISDAHALKEWYGGSCKATGYVRERFSSELNRLLHERQVGAVQNVLETFQPERILELAPGPARLTRDLRLTGLTVCLEYNEAMIAEGRKACPPARWIRGDAFRLPFDQSFDLVYSFRFVRHFRLPDRNKLYNEIRRVLRPGGLFVLDAVNEYVSRPLREAHPAEYVIYDQLCRPEDLQAELGAAGFHLLHLQPVQKYFAYQSLSQVLLGPRVNWLNWCVIRTLEKLPGREGLEWIVTCQRA